MDLHFSMLLAGTVLVPAAGLGLVVHSLRRGKAGGPAGSLRGFLVGLACCAAAWGPLAVTVFRPRELPDYPTLIAFLVIDYFILGAIYVRFCIRRARRELA